MKQLLPLADVVHTGAALSPLDGRYHAQLSDLRGYFSEFALMRARCAVEIHHALALDVVFGALTATERTQALAVVEEFSAADYADIKQLEATLRHDVKACEVFLRNKGLFSNPNRIHFGLTSEDVNNVAYSMGARDYVHNVQLPMWAKTLQDLIELAQASAAVAFPARTHGQHATPTTFGKELSVFIGRLLPVYQSLKQHRFSAKLNGATGNYAALMVAAPQVDWREHERKFIESLCFSRNIATTQIEDCASLGLWFDLVRRWNGVLLDLSRDIWLYISYGYVTQRSVAGEVGSSTMPHKINPIRFENAEGNLELSCGQLGFLAEKLSHSRMQRDLSGSTVMRNIGVALGHHQLAVMEIQKGLTIIDVDSEVCARELAAHPELLSEAAQTVLRTHRSDDVYTLLKDLSRGKHFSLDTWQTLLAELPQDTQLRLKDLTPQTYVGDSVRICREVCALALAELGP